MRIRLTTLAPLPVLKAWFDADLDPSSYTVSDLKHAICNGINILRQAGVRAEQVVLVMDEWELLDECSVRIVRDGEVLCIRRRGEQSDKKRKRKRISESPSDGESSASRSSSSFVASSSSSSLDTGPQPSSSKSIPSLYPHAALKRQVSPHA